MARGATRVQATGSAVTRFPLLRARVLLALYLLLALAALSVGALFLMALSYILTGPAGVSRAAPPAFGGNGDGGGVAAPPAFGGN